MTFDEYAAAQDWLADIGYPVTDSLQDTEVAVNALYHGGLQAFIADAKFTTYISRSYPPMTETTYPYVTDKLGVKATNYRPGNSYAVWAPSMRVIGVFDVRWDGYVEATRYGTYGGTRDSYYTHSTPDAATLWIAEVLTP